MKICDEYRKRGETVPRMLGSIMTESSTTTIAIESALNRFSAGDASAKDELIHRAMERLAMIARRLLRGYGGEQRVEMWTNDLFGEAYPRLSKALDDVRPTSVPQFFGLARLQFERVLLDTVRKKPRTVPFSQLPPNSSCSSQAIDVKDAQGGDGDLIIDLVEAISKLPEKQAETVWLKLAGHTHREIGELLGVHHDTIDGYWQKAAIKLVRHLAPFMPRL